MLTGIGVLVAAGTMLSFTMKDDKMKKYEVIHREEGKTVVYDTLLPIDSKYTVENFLKDKGIEPSNLQVIKMMKGGEHGVFVHENGEKHRVRVHQMEEDGENVQISVKKDDQGNTTIVKKVNGVEVPLTAEEKAEVESNLKDGKHRVIVKKHGDMSRGAEGNEERVEIKAEIDENGKLNARKFVNGKEVELTPEELEEIKSHKGDKGEHVVIINGDQRSGDHFRGFEGKEGEGERVEIKCEKDESGNVKMQKFVNGKEVPLTDEEKERIKLHEGKHGKHMLMRTISEDTGESDTKKGDKKIIRIVKTDDKTVTIDENGNEVIDEDHDINWVSNDDENFTLVFVTIENDSSSAKNGSAAKTVKSGETSADVKVYPNPNNGEFVIVLNQAKKMKTSINVTDALGKKVFEVELGDFEGAFSEKLNLKDFGAGTYIVTVNQGKKKTTKKIVVE